MFSFKLWFSFGEVRGSFEIGRPRSRGWKYFGSRWTRGGAHENWTIFMDVIYVSPLTRINSF